MPPKRARGRPPGNNVDPNNPAAILAAMQAMQRELATLRQTIPIAPTGSASAAATQGATVGAIPAGAGPGGAVPAGSVPGGAVPVGAAVPGGAIPGGAAEVPPPVSGIL